jgi:6-methylsalicylate decarboxylase
MRAPMNEFSAHPLRDNVQRRSSFRASRREFMGSVFAAGASAVLGPSLAKRLLAQSAPTAGAAKVARIDLHYHVTPTPLIQAFGAQRFANAASNWTLDQRIMDLEQNGVATAMCSVAPAGDPFADPSKAAQLTRECNEYSARLAMDHPGRFGVFASLPLPNVDAALHELEYAFDTLKADGIALFTSYGDKWLGDPAFNPIFEELNRRKAVLFTHPNTANCCKNLLPNIGDGTIEWGTDTTRAITNLLFSGTAARYPNVRMTFSHGGGTMPYLVARFEALAKSPKFAAQFPQGFGAAAGKFYYDTAWTTNPEAMSALSKLVPISQIVFGTDFPFLTIPEQLKGLKDCGAFSPADLAKIDRENALAFLPRFRV